MKTQSLYQWFLRAAPVLVLVCFLAQAVLSTRLSVWLHPDSFEVASVQRMDKRVASTLRAVAFLSGFRVLVGHAFWIQVIQYYGDSGNSVTRYANLYDYCSLASDLNPRFIPIYTYGAAALSLHLKRFDEAERLLQKGIQSNPHESRLQLMLAAIVYQHTENYEKVIPALELQIIRGDAPVMLANMLANTYQKVGRFQDAVRLWQKILRESESDEKRIEAARKLQELYAIMKAKKP